MRKLYYSEGSPFARKVRVVLAEKELEFEGDAQGLARTPAELAPINPNLQVPVFQEGELVLFESNLILDYLLQTHPGTAPGAPAPPLAETLTRPEHHWEDAKTLATLETLGNAMVNLRQLALSGVDAGEVAYLQRQQARTQSCLDWLEERATPEGFAPGLFSIMDLNLICLVEFSDAREEIFQWRGRPRLEALAAHFSGRPSLIATPPGPPPAG